MNQNNDKSEITALFIFSIIASVSLGMWAQNFFAGVFCFCIILIATFIFEWGFMIAIKDAEYKVKIEGFNKYYFSASTKKNTNLASDLIELESHDSKLKAKNSWKRFAALNGITKYKFVEWVMTKKELFIERVGKSELDNIIIIEDLQNELKSIRFSKYPYNSNGFYWISYYKEINYKELSNKNGETQFFKTLSGCKRNFIKRFEHLFE